MKTENLIKEFAKFVKNKPPKKLMAIIKEFAKEFDIALVDAKALFWYALDAEEICLSNNYIVYCNETRYEHDYSGKIANCVKCGTTHSTFNCISYEQWQNDILQEIHLTPNYDNDRREHLIYIAERYRSFLKQLFMDNVDLNLRNKT